MEQPISISFRGRSVVRSKVSEDDWKLAKLHLQVMMTFYPPGMAHNWVHFVFPSAMAVNAMKVSDTGHL